MKKLSQFILKHRLWLIVSVLLISLTLGYYALKVEIAFKYVKLLPETDSTTIRYEKFKKYFGQDGAVMVVGIDLNKLYAPQVFQKWTELGNQLKVVKGIQSVVSISRLKELLFNDSLQKFEFKDKNLPTEMSSVSIKNYIDDVIQLKFYDGIIFSKKNNLSAMAITFYEKELNSKERLSITDTVVSIIRYFEKETGIQVHLSGMPYIRTVMMRKISSETQYFFYIGLLVTALLLWFFFRSPAAILFSALVVVLGVVSSLGVIVLLGYKLSILSGLVPALLIIIGVPNCILILNKYHHELNRNKTKNEALLLAIQNAAPSLFFANITTAIGFSVLCATQNQLLYEFGLVASICVMLVFLYSIILLPAIFSWLPVPKAKHLKHQEKKWLKQILNSISLWVVHQRKIIFLAVLIVVVVSVFGFIRIKAIGHVVDDLPKKDILMEDLSYFEQKIGGVLPFEIVIDTKKKNGIFSNNAKTLYRIHRAQKLLSQYNEFGRSLSIADAVKFFNQAYKGGEAKFFKMPSVTDLKNIADYLKSENTQNKTIQNFMDSTKQITRISTQMKNISSVEIDELLNKIKLRLDSIFNYDEDNKQWLSKEEQTDIAITGNSVMFLKGNNFLVNNLIESIFTAIIIVAILLLILFASPFMLLVAIIPCLSLLITSGIMGYFGIPLKPSTLLVYSISFGIATDGNLYFLSRFRIAIKRQHKSFDEAIRITIKEIGMSMIYNGLVLFFGFGMFALSDFGGTKALGTLTAFTLLVAYSVDLIVLPAVLLTFKKFIKIKQHEGSDTLIDLDTSD